MPEQLASQEMSSIPLDPGIAGQYRRILDQPDTHPALRGTLERLINENTNPADIKPTSGDDGWEVVPERSASFGVEVATASDKSTAGNNNPDLKLESPKKPTKTLSEMVVGIKEHSQQIANTEGLFEGNFWPDFNVHEVIKNGEYTAGQLADFIYESIELKDTYDNKTTPNKDNSSPHDYLSVLSAVVKAPIEKQQAVFHDPNLSSGFRRIIEHSKNYYLNQMDLDILKNLYDCDDALDLFEPGSMSAEDPLVIDLLKRNDIEEELTAALDMKSNIWQEDLDPIEISSDKRDWAYHFLNWVVGLPENQLDELLLASEERTTNRSNGYVNAYELRNMLMDTFKSVQMLGVEQVQKLREVTGIVNLDYYSLEELELMSNLINGDPATIEHLQAGDTTVVMTDAKGDYNAALRSPGYDFDTLTGRTLFFEINRPSDLYRHMVLLNKLGVRPSTLVLSAHGVPGAIYFGRGKDAFDILSSNVRADKEEFKPTEMGISGAKGLPRMVQDMMQDSRGIDDNPKAAGRRRIILAACYQAKPVPIIRKRPYSEGEQKGASTSTSGKTKYKAYSSSESTAETLAKEVGPKVDVYAGDDSLAIGRTDNGIELKAVIDTPEGKRIKKPLEATHTYLNDRGYLVSRRIRRVALRRESDNNVSEGRRF